jgi:hypothetical protein
MESIFPSSFKYVDEFVEILRSFQINSEEEFFALKSDTDRKIIKDLAQRLQDKVFKHTSSTRTADKSLAEEIFRNQIVAQISPAIDAASAPMVTPDYFTRRFVEMFGGPPSPALSSFDLVDSRQLVDDLGVYRELKLNKKNSSGTGDLKPVALVDGTTNFIREANSGRELSKK